jgi:hypothetical protein
MVQHLRFIMTERGKLLDEAIALLDGLTAPLIRRIKGIRRQLESFRPKTPSATASRSRAQHTQGLREALEEMLLLQRQLRQVDELGLSTFKPLSKLVLARACGGNTCTRRSTEGAARACCQGPITCAGHHWPHPAVLATVMLAAHIAEIWSQA